MTPTSDLFKSIDTVPAVRKRLRVETESRADELRPYIDAADKFVSGVVRRLGPWAGLWWLDGLIGVMACKQWNREQGKRDHPAAFLRTNFHRPHTIVLSADAAKCPTLTDEERESLNLLCAVTSMMDDVGRGSVVANLDNEKFSMLVRAVVAELWDEREMKVLRSWLRPTVRAAQQKKDERAKKRAAARTSIRRNLPFPEQLSKWEKDFIADLLRRGRVTEKQQEILDAIKAERGREVQGFAR